MYKSTHVYNVELWGHPEINKKVHVTNMVPWSAKLEGTPSEAIQQLQERAFREHNNAFLVKDIIGYDTDGGELRLQVHWYGFDSEAATLEPLSNLSQVQGTVLSYLGLHKDEHPLLLDAFEDLSEQRRQKRLQRLNQKKATALTNANTVTEP